MLTARSCDLAGAVKEALTAEDVARRYGFEPNRADFIQCPFHQGDNHASLKLYPDSRGWYCFGCNAHGSVIDFVMLLFGISFTQAIVRLNADFGLGLTAERPSPAARSKALEERRRASERAQKTQGECEALALEHRYWHEVKALFEPSREAWEAGVIHPLYIEALKRLPKLEWEIEEWENEYERIKHNSSANRTA